MVHCWSTSAIPQSIDHIRTAQRKQPHPANVLKYVFRHFGLNISEWQELLNSLMMLVTVYNKSNSAGLTSLVFEKDNYVNKWMNYSATTFWILANNK